jgi:hypothetical protein
MHRTFSLIASLLLCSAPAFAASGYAHGPDHCYHFEAPTGWTMDNRSAASSGVPMVFYPSGSSWQTAPLAIYTRPMASSAVSSPEARIREQVEQVIQMYRSSAQGVQAKLLQKVRSKSGAAGELWSFTGYRNGGAELVVYFAGPKTVNFFVAQLSEAQALQASIPTILELAASYRESTECKPCSNANSCTAPN